MKEDQGEDPHLCRIRDKVKEGKMIGFSMDAKGVLRFENHLCVPSVEALRREILNEVQKSAYAIYLGATEIYQDLKQVYWWDDMNKEGCDRLCTPLLDLSVDPIA